MAGLNRRELMRIGGLSLAGLSLAELVRAGQSDDSRSATSASFGRARNVIFLFLNGGPPQHETFDPKPAAPREIRGPFQPIQTNVPGIQFCELLPRTARLAHQLAVVRSLATDDHVHSSSGHWVLTGAKYLGPNARTVRPTDWPYFGSLIKRYLPSRDLPGLTSVMVPDVIRLNENVMPAGQTGGLLGPQWNPERFVGDPSRPAYRIEGLEPLGLTTDRFRQRASLLAQLEDRLRELEGNARLDTFNTFQRQAYELLTSGKARQAFNIADEPAAVRDRYGRNRWGQCVLLARRLIESGVRLVHVNWPREPGDNAVDNPLWDTHAQNHDRVEDVLCPMFDVGFSALIEDLAERGLLDETLVVAVGEFGRTPKINAKAGRDHWGSVFSCVLAGAGVAGGQLFGRSDAHGAYPVADRVEPGHLTATMFHLLGLDHRGTFRDPAGRELPLTNQPPLYKLLGDEAATAARVPAGGDVARVPAFDEARILASRDFRGPAPILSADRPSRPKGWRSLTPVQSAAATGWGLFLLPAEDGKWPQHAAVGWRNPTLSPLAVDAAPALLLAQEVRSPFAGTYRLQFRVQTDGDRGVKHRLLLDEFEYRAVYLQLTDSSKQITQVRELASQPMQFEWSDQVQQVAFERSFQNPRPGANFSFGLGLAVGLSVRRRREGPLQLPPGAAWLRLLAVELEFLGKEVNPDVVV